MMECDFSNSPIKYAGSMVRRDDCLNDQASDVPSTPSPWLTQIRFTRISLTRIFKKFPFLT